MVETDYSPKTLWRLERDGLAVECILMPHAKHMGCSSAWTARLVMPPHFRFNRMPSGGPKNSA